VVRENKGGRKNKKFPDGKRALYRAFEGGGNVPNPHFGREGRGKKVGIMRKEGGHRREGALPKKEALIRLQPPGNKDHPKDRKAKEEKELSRVLPQKTMGNCSL